MGKNHIVISIISEKSIRQDSVLVHDIHFQKIGNRGKLSRLDKDNLQKELIYVMAEVIVFPLRLEQEKDVPSCHSFSVVEIF